MSGMRPEFERARREIVELHDAFAAWMGAGADVFQRFEAALAQDFSMVGPGAKRLDRAGVLAMLGGLRGAFGAGFGIRIDAFQPLSAGPGFVAVGYDEIQIGRPGPSQRRASALLCPDPVGPNGLRWLAVHETWIADA
jgi:hypothetical protein